MVLMLVSCSVGNIPDAVNGVIKGSEQVSRLKAYEGRNIESSGVMSSANWEFFLGICCYKGGVCRKKASLN